MRIYTWMLFAACALLGGCSKVTEVAVEQAVGNIPSTSVDGFIDNTNNDPAVTCGSNPMVVADWQVEYLQFSITAEDATLTTEAVEAGIESFDVEGDVVELDDPGYYKDAPEAAGKLWLKASYHAGWTDEDGVSIKLSAVEFAEQSFCTAQLVPKPGETVDCSTEPARCHNEATAKFRILSENPGGGNPYSYAFDGAFVEVSAGVWDLEGQMLLELVQGQLTPVLDLGLPREH